MSGIPKLKKKVSSFLTKEDGKISKENIIKAGAILGAIAVASESVVGGHSNHSNNIITLKYIESTSSAEAVHSHDNHNSHSSHSSY